jgi:hypothetical protein
LKKILNYRYISELFLVIFGLISGLCLFRNYGASWDEPDLYKYATQSLSAYSIHDRAEGQFNLDSLLGPDNLRLYGPAYLVAGQIIVNIVQTLNTGIPAIDLWHLLNYLMLVLGIVFFYRLLHRWFDTWPAFISSLLFATQPLLFGIAWIDPKDIPFMVLFIISIYTGLSLADRTELVFKSTPAVRNSGEVVTLAPGWMKTLGIVSAILSFLSAVGWIFKPSILVGMNHTILGMSNRPADDLLLKTFSSIARNSNAIPLETYAAKAGQIFSNSLIAISILAGVFILLTVSIRLYPGWISGTSRFTVNVLNTVFLSKPANRLNWTVIASFLMASLVLGLTTSTRVLGPFAGLLISIELFRQIKWKSIPLIVIYGFLAVLVTIAAWPYLWENTAGRFGEVFLHMAENPVGVGVLFRSIVYDSKELPLEYLPWLMIITLTIPAVILCITGFFNFVSDWGKKNLPAETWIMAAWFLVPFGYVLVNHPPMYDNYRHFLFILPAVFFFGGLVVNRLMKVTWPWIKAVVVLIILVPGIVGIIQSHPYEYTYYNELVGGMTGAAGKYEVDYWLTCYRDLTLQVNSNEKDADNIFAAFMPDLVRYYADKRFIVFKANDPSYPPGSLIFLPLRRQSLTLYSELPEAYSVVHNGVTLCAARRSAR